MRKIIAILLCLLASACSLPAAQQAQRLEDQALALQRAKRYDDAIEKYRQAIALDPAVARMPNNLGVVQVDAKRYEDALTSFDEALRLDPTLANAHYSKGVALVALKRFAPAIAEFSRALELAPDLRNAYVRRGAAWRELGELDKALDDLEHLDRMSPPGEARAIIGYTHFEMGRFSDSAEDFRRSGEQSLEGGGISAWRYLARRRAGDDEASAQAELAQHRALLKDTTSWPAPALDYFQGRLTASAVIAAAQAADGGQAPVRRCMADLFIGETLLLRAQFDDARAHLREVVDRCPVSVAARIATADIARITR